MSFAGALYGVSGAASRNSYKPGKMESFGCQFAGIIVLENSILKPYGKITGQLAIDTGWPIRYHGLRIQLEAQCTLKFETKLDGRVSLHKKYDNIMEGTGERDSSDSYQTSPIMTDIEPPRESYEYYDIPAGNHRYRFSLNITGETLPAPFKTQYGSLKYKLVAYMSTCSQWVQIGEKELRFSGYNNLSQNVDALKPVEIARVVKKSIFSSKKLISCVLKLDSCAYLISEELPFTLCVDNPKGLSLKLSISLTQRCIYNIDGAKKTTVAVLDSCEHEVNEPEKEYAWVGFLNVHKAAAPSYCIHPMYTVSHVLQFTVKVDDYNMVKGEVLITIGSTREPVELLMISANSLNVDDRFPTRRRLSNSSTHSDCSGLSHFTLPPAYSQLSSRAPSYETLPPPYDSEEDLLKVHQGKRRQSCVEFRVIPPEETSENGSHQPVNITPASTPITDD